MLLPVSCLLLFLVSGVVVAESSISESELEALLRVKIRTVQHMALNPVLVRAVRQQNGQRLSLEEIKQRDQEWKATKGTSDFKRSLQENEPGRFLRKVVSGGDVFNEAFLTDNQGANVAAYPATSDYWQGDEEKWSASFNEGQGKIYLGALEKDESTNTMAVQISAPVLDGRETLGVLVVGVSLAYLQGKEKQ